MSRGGWHGLLLAITSSLFFSVCSLVAKFLSDVHPIHLSCVGFLGILLVSTPTVICHSLLPRGYITLLFFRSSCGTLFLISSFYAAQHLPLGDASVLFYTAPIFTLVLAKWLLGEPFPPYSFLVISSILLGVILVTQPPFLFTPSEQETETSSTSQYWLGVCFALLASFSEAVGNIALRKLKNIHFGVVLFYYGVISLSLTIFVSSFFTTLSLPQPEELPLLLVLSIFTCAEQILMVLALSKEHAGPVALVQASDIIYGYIYQIVFFNQQFNTCSALGATIVACVVVYITKTNINAQKGI